MVRLLAFVEGATEERFIKETVAPALRAVSIDMRATTPGAKRSQGGVRPWGSTRLDLIAFLKEDNGRYVTTMFDYYGMPMDWPGRQQACTLPCASRATAVEDAILAEVSRDIGHTFNPQQFIPYIQMHEFEALLFSDAITLGAALPAQNAGNDLQAVANAFPTPEEIDDSPLSAPSKRILSICEAYQKVLHGNIAAQRIGLHAMRAKCPHFDAWLDRLEALP
jgi:hypothetical protein